MTDLLDGYLGGDVPGADADPLDQYFREQREARQSVQLRQAGNPDTVSRANVIARQQGLPPTVVEKNLPRFESQKLVEQAVSLQRKVAGFDRWSQDERNAASAADDYAAIGAMGEALRRRVERDQNDFVVGSGFVDRMGDLFRRAVYSLDAGADTVRGALQEWSANNPLPWTSKENIEADRRGAATARALARINSRAASTGVADETTFADVKSKPGIGTVGGFVLDQGIGSAPGMAQAALSLPLYITGQAGNIAATRAEAKGKDAAGVRELGEAAPAAVASGLLERLGIEAIFGAHAKNAVLRTLQAGGGEAATEFLQSGIEYLGGRVGTGKAVDYGQMFDQQLAGALAGFGMGGGLRGGVEATRAVVRPATKLVQRFRQADAATHEGLMLDRLGEAAAGSKLRTRDPEAFASLVRELGADTGIEQVFIPADALQSYMQLDGYDGGFDSYRDAIDEGVLTGGDVVLPLETVIGQLAGTPGWAALRDDMRLSPGGMSPREAQTFDDAMADIMADLSDKMADQQAAEAGMREPREKLFQAVSDKLMNAGFTPSMARQQAELLTLRMATRATRMGRDITGTEFDPITVNRVLPPELAAVQKADQVDMTIDVMKRGLDPKGAGSPSLLDFISKAGGVEDTGGDLKAMGADKWHVGKPGKRRLVRATEADQPRLMGEGGLGKNANTLDDMARRAWDAGYFPELTERPSVNDLLDAIAEGVSGRDRFADVREQGLRDAAEALRALLENRGVDPATATRREIRSAVDAYTAEQSEGFGYDQGEPVATLTGEEIAPAGTDVADLRKAAKEWFKANLTGKTVESDALGGPVQFGTSRKPISSSADPRKLQLFAAIPDLIAHAPRVDTVEDTRGIRQIKAWHYLRGTVDLGGEPISVTLSVREETDGKFYYNHVIEESAAPQRTDPASKAGGGSGDSAYDQSIPENADGINMTLNAGGEDQPRGRVTFPGGYDGSAIIDLFENADQSTFIHEMNHVWLEELRFDAADPNAPQQLRDDWQAVQDWFAANGHPIVDGVIPVEAHEMWARAGEQYLMEGKSPSLALRRLFQSFKAWMISVYHTVSRLRVPMNDEIRAVMDRLVATDEELADAVAAQHIEALFPEKPDTMTEAEYAAYREQTDNAVGAAHDAVLAKVMNGVRRRVTKEYRDREADVRADVEASIDARPEYRAIRMLRDTPLDSQWVRDFYGEEALSMLPKQVPPIFRDGGANPDEVAELSGFTSGDEMVRTLMGVETRRRELREGGDKRSVRKALIDQEVERIMLERYGDPLSDGSIEDEALAAVHSDQQGEVIAAEMRVLARSTGQRITPYSIAKEWAARSVREGKVNDVASRGAIRRYERAAAKAGQAAMEAVIAGDRLEAFRQKQAQMLNNALVFEAKRAADDIDNAVSRLEKWAKRRTMKSVDQDYLERAQALLEQVDMKPRSQRFIDRRDSFEAWAEAQEAQGHDIIVPRSFAASLGTTHWSRLSVDQLLSLDDAVRQIIHLGRLKQTLIDNKEKRDFEDVVNEALNGMGGMKRRPPSDLMEPSRWDSIKARVASADVALLKMETIVDWLDQGRSDGAFNRVVFRPIAEAQDRENAMQADYHARLRGIFEKVDRKQLRRWSENFSSPALMNRETGKPYKMKREQLIAIALNMGNAGNKQRLVDGYRWSEQSVRDVLNRELTPQDWQFVQSVWDLVDTLWPQIAAMERRVNGLEPDKVEAVPIDTPNGQLRGGYYPAIYDTSKSYAAEAYAGKASDLLETTYTKATTRASSTKERSEEVKRPLLLQLGVINRHLGEVIHDITHREVIMQADKFLRDERIMQAVDETLGAEVRKSFRPWLKHVANQWAAERAGNEGLGRFIQKLRANTTIVGMGFRASTILTQIAGYSNSFEYVGAKWVSAALAQTVVHPIDTYNFVMERSGEIRSRMDTLDRDIRATLAEMQGRNNPITAAQRFAFHGIGYADRVVVIPTWIGAFNKAQAAGKSEQDAIYAADKAVRLSQGAGSAKDLAAVQRGTGKWGEAMKFLTMFYSYMSAFYQRERTLGRDIVGAARKRAVGDLPALMARSFWLIMVPPVLSQILGGNGPEEDEDWTLWAFQQMLFQMLGPIPIVRDAAPPIWDKIAGEKGFDYQFTPIQRAIQTAVNTAGDVSKLIQGEDTKRATRNALETVGYMTGLVPGQIATSAQFLVDVAAGDQDPETVDEWYRGLTKGKTDDR